MVRTISLKWRAVFGVTLLIVAVLVLVSAVQMHFMRRDFSRVLSDQQFGLVSRVASELDAKFATYTDLLVRSAGALPLPLLRSPEGLREFYRARPGLLASFDDILVLAPDGRVIADFPRVPGRVDASAADRAYFRKLLATHRPVISEPLLGRTTGEPIVQIAVPLLDEQGQMLGALIGVLRLYSTNFLADLASAQVGKTGYFIVLTKESQPRYVIHPDKRRIMQARTNANNSSVARALGGFEGTVEDFNDAGTRALFSYKSLKTTDWLLIALVPTAEAYSPIDDATHRLWLICLVVSLLVVPLVWSLAWLILRPVSTLRDEIDKLRRGGRGYRPVLVAGGDEVGDLTRSFNALMRERAVAEIKQRDTEERLRMITDNLPALIAYVDAEQRYLFVNRTFAHWYGRPHHEYLGRGIREVIGEEGYAIAGPMAQRALAGETVTYQRRMHEPGEPRHIETTLVPDRAPEGRVVGLYILINDITAIKHAKDQLHELNAELEQRVHERTAALAYSNQELETFAYSVAHDFRAPLRAMDGYSALLLEEHSAQLAAQGRDYLARIRDSSTRLAHLIDDLLRLVQLAQRKIHPEPVDLSALAAQVVTELRALQPRLWTDVHIAPGMAVIGDRALLIALLRELIGNAWKFTAARDDARIEIGIQAHGAGQAFYVRDNGIGFDMAFAQKVFAPFARLHGSDQFTGTGIGLALAKRIVERHGGRIWAQAEQGQGAMLLFTLGG